MDPVEGIGVEVIVSVTLGLVILLALIGWRHIKRESPTRRQEEDDGESEQDAMNRHAYNTSICPICWNEQAFALETNCGHLYCGACLKTFHERNVHSLTEMSCPMCRQKVTLVIPCFSAEERNSQNPVLNEITMFARQYNRIMSEGCNFFDYIAEIPVLLRRFFIQLVRGDNFGTNYMRLRLLFFIFSTFIYILLPYDIIPEVVYGFYGFVEDILALAILIFYINHFYRHFLSQE